MLLIIRRWKVRIAIVAAVGALAFGASAAAFAAAPHSAAPRVLSESLWDNGFHSPTFSLHAHAHNVIMTTCHSGCGAQAWNMTLCGNHRFWNGQVFGVCNLRLVGANNECANYVPSGNSFFLDSCVGGDPNEQFVCCIAGGGTFTLTNAAASDLNRAFTNLSAFSLAENSPVVGEIAGTACRGCDEWFYAP